MKLLSESNNNLFHAKQRNYVAHERCVQQIVWRTYSRQQTMSSNLTIHCMHSTYQAVTVIIVKIQMDAIFSGHSLQVIYD